MLAPPQLLDWRFSDGYVARGRYWPARRRDGLLAFVYLHGIQSHGGWFEWSASRLAATGAAVLLPDRRGSGLNPAARGDVPNVARWRADLNELADWLAKHSGARRFGLVGVSWGGKLALDWALAHPARVAKLMLVAPGLFPAVGLGLVEQVRVGWSLLRDPERRFSIPLDDPALFTQDRDAQRFIAQDPLKLNDATARFLVCSRRLDRQIVRHAPGSLAAPTTLVLAGRDRIIRNASTRRWLGRVCAAPPEIHEFADAEHTLEFEPCRAQFGELMGRWAESRPNSEPDRPE